ncbi:hypothetical protein B484DRAFT_186184 [Ochromonadaceae sp. CCMP2298]|nr:hypothetical protein B484DRAFT_186184 [Ochromonadaceae sp. CCMP2298]
MWMRFVDDKDHYAGLVGTKTPKRNGGGGGGGGGGHGGNANRQQGTDREYFANMRTQVSQWVSPYASKLFRAQDLEMGTFVEVMLRYDVLASSPLLEQINHIQPKDLWPNAEMFLKQMREKRRKDSRTMGGKGLLQGLGQGGLGGLLGGGGGGVGAVGVHGLDPPLSPDSNDSPASETDRLPHIPPPINTRPLTTPTPVGRASFTSSRRLSRVQSATPNAPPKTLGSPTPTPRVLPLPNASQPLPQAPPPRLSNPTTALGANSPDRQGARKDKRGGGGRRGSSAKMGGPGRSGSGKMNKEAD